MKVLLITPPMLQINTPYPATGYLTAYLRRLGHEVVQRDFSLALALKIFSREGLRAVAQKVSTQPVPRSAELEFFLSAADDYVRTVESVIRFLQGQDDSLALRIVQREFLPEGPRFSHLNQHPELLDRFGSMGLSDQAKYLASLYIDDLADYVRQGVDPRFELSRYGEKLADSQASFTPLYAGLKGEKTLLDDWLDELLSAEVAAFAPQVVGLTCPFPGNVYGALAIGRWLKAQAPNVKVVMGGGYVNTELRDLSDPRVFEFIDFLLYDSGERPFELLLKSFAEPKSVLPLLRTKRLNPKGEVEFVSAPSAKDVPFKQIPAPTYEGLALHRYLQMLELPNPMARLWTDFRWNKLILAHGCYWKRCTFCDVSLDYISGYEPARVDDVIAHMEKLAAETGVSGFHFVDEAAPPALLKALSQRLIERGLNFTWWGNLRFDTQFTPEVATLMRDAGCVAVTGGIEVASPRLLKLIDKGITVEQVARVTKAFSDAGIFVHAYLMYGFPSQTRDETIESLEVVRRLFAEGCLHSAYWHRFVATVHSPVGRDPKKFGIRLLQPTEPPEGWFGRNGVAYEDSVKCDHDTLGAGLRRAVYNYMHGVGLERDVREWFQSVPLKRARGHRKTMRHQAT